MMEIVEGIEANVRTLAEGNDMQSGHGFPTGLSLNNCAAHYTPNPGDTMGMCLPPPFSLPLFLEWTMELTTIRPILFPVLKQSDVMKCDIGVHVNGRIWYVLISFEHFFGLVF
jgi:methionyl aminopeptidase